MDQFCKGNTSAFDALYERHARLVYAFLQRMVGHREMAEDLLQITFMSVIRGKSRYDSNQRFSSWLYAIAANATRDAIKRRSYRNERTPLSDETDEPIDSVLPDPPMMKRVEKALEQLPVDQRECIVLHRIFGWTFEQMSESLGASAATLRVKTHRAESKLRQMLGDIWEQS